MNDAIDLPRELLSTLLDGAHTEADRRRRGQLCVAIGSDPALTIALVKLIQASNEDPLEKMKAIEQHVGLALGEVKNDIEEAVNKIKWFYLPGAGAGLAVMTTGAIGVVATLGTGGAALIAIAGAALFGFSARGIARLSQEVRKLQDDLTAVGLLGAALGDGKREVAVAPERNKT